jgi:TonB family protein
MNKIIITLGALIINYFSIQAQNKPDSIVTLIVEETVLTDGAYLKVDEMPTFNGTTYGFREYIAKNMKYPKEAAKNREQGKVLVQFCVDSVGNVCDVKVLKSVSTALDAEAVRIVSQSPKWKPGKLHGKSVKVRFTFPINFSFQ